MRTSITPPVTVTVAIAAAALALAACGGDAGDGGETDDEGSARMGAVSIRSVEGTDVLVDSEGRTLYTAEVEKGGQVLCVQGCTSFWDPVTSSPGEAEAAAAALDVDLGVVERPDGERQLTFDGLPLYSFTDEGPGQLEGDGFTDDFAGTRFEWQAAATGGRPESPGSAAPRGGSPY